MNRRRQETGDRRQNAQRPQAAQRLQAAQRPQAAQRLQKVLSQAGVASRRVAEELIVQGRVQVNGRTVTELGTKADPDADEIRVDGRRIQTQKRKRYILLNKPRGYITSRNDPKGRPTVLDL